MPPFKIWAVFAQKVRDFHQNNCRETRSSRAILSGNGREIFQRRKRNQSQLENRRRDSLQATEDSKQRESFYDMQVRNGAGCVSSARGSRRVPEAQGCDLVPENQIFEISDCRGRVLARGFALWLFCGWVRVFPVAGFLLEGAIAARFMGSLAAEAPEDQAAGCVKFPH